MIIHIINLIHSKFQVLIIIYKNNKILQINLFELMVYKIIYYDYFFIL